jgi:1-phosphofructokinase/tagatose 6-phosphate kinase
MYLTVSMNPTLQKVLCFSSIEKDRVNRSPRHRFDIAGKGLNVCRVLSQLGKKAVHLTPLGGDLRPLFLEKSAREGLAVEWVESGSPIRFCYTLISEEDQSVTELIENTEPVKPGTEERLMEAYERLLPDCDTVVIAGTKAAGFSGGLVPLMVRRARETGQRVVLDLWGPDLVNSLEFKPWVIKPNLAEFAATWEPDLLLRNELIDDEEAVKDRVRKRCRDLCGQYRCAVVITRGVKPVWFAREGAFSEYSLETPERDKPVNTTGSGDAFTAGLAAALGDGAELRDAVAQGARCGGLNARFLRVGTIADR